MGIDVAGFSEDNGLAGLWDNYQCKHYNDPLKPSTAAAEIAKVLWHSFQGEYQPPRRYAFIAPKECGMSLKKLLMKPEALKQHVVENWDKQCANAVTTKLTISLSGAFASYVDSFDFSIFGMQTTLEIIDAHRTTPYYAVRFGGGLKERPKAAPAPGTIAPQESRYVEQLYEAYEDHLKKPVGGLPDLTARLDLVEHFHRQREFFYHAESLRNFARDTVPEGTFEDLQTEIQAGVIDVEAAPQADGYRPRQRAGGGEVYRRPERHLWRVGHRQVVRSGSDRLHARGTGAVARHSRARWLRPHRAVNCSLERWRVHSLPRYERRSISVSRWCPPDTAAGCGSTSPRL